MERIVVKFSEVYQKDNPVKFVNPDTPFILAYSVIMLQTDLHNKKIEENKKMKIESFVRNNVSCVVGNKAKDKETGEVLPPAQQE